LMTSIYGIRPGHWMVKLLERLERLSITISQVVLTPNVTFRNLFIRRGCPEKKIEIVMNSPQPDIFAPDRFSAETDEPDRSTFRVMHHGSIVHRHGVDHLVEAISMVAGRIPNVHLDLYGAATPFLDEVLELAQRLGIADRVTY